MSIAVADKNFRHQALNPRDPRLPVELMIGGPTAVTGDASGGVQGVVYTLRSVADQAPSSQVYSVAAVYFQYTEDAPIGYRVIAAGFRVGGSVFTRRWQFRSESDVEGQTIPDAAPTSLRNTLLGTPTDTVDGSVSMQVNNVLGALLTCRIVFYRFLPTVFQSGGPIYPEGQY